jgi:SAM-dependent methyltransferase
MAWSAPAAERNKEPILQVLGPLLPESGTVLEIASGTGQHAVHFAAAHPALKWQPSDADEDARECIFSWIEESTLANVAPPLDLDVLREPWPIESAEAVVCINMIHISPWTAAEALLKGAGRILSPGGLLFLYGPYRRGGRHTAPSNEAFDASLRKQNPEWGVRDMEAVVGVAVGAGLMLADVVSMPANNFSLILRRAPAF